MKKIIRWFAEVSGVSKDIRRETCKEVGSSMQQYAYWYTGGLRVQGTKFDISNILHEYPERCLNQGAPHLYGPQFSDLREYLWKLSDAKKSIIVENDKQHENRQQLFSKQ